MRFYIFCTIVLLSFIFSTCKKDKVEMQYPFVPLNACVEKTLSQQKVEMCFNKIIEDSRCSINAVCIWAGVAKANFTFKANNEQHTFDLATNEIKPGYTNDTTIFGYKIRLVNIRPQPGEPSSNPVAEIEVSK
ncbi:MAG: hypothetical protein V4676_00625 [Bacteroidota bacterium]